MRQLARSIGSWQWRQRAWPVGDAPLHRYAADAGAPHPHTRSARAPRVPESRAPLLRAPEETAAGACRPRSVDETTGSSRPRRTSWAIARRSAARLGAAFGRRRGTWSARSPRVQRGEPCFAPTCRCPPGGPAEPHQPARAFSARPSSRASPMRAAKAANRAVGPCHSSSSTRAKERRIGAQGRQLLEQQRELPPLAENLGREILDLAVAARRRAAPFGPIPAMPG